LKLGEKAVIALRDAMRDRLDGSQVQLWDELTLLVTLRVGEGSAEADVVTFGPMAPATAVASGTPSLFRIIDAAGDLVIEGNADGLTLEPSSSIEQGASVTIAGMTYRQPSGSL
jgi:hypothetical protein